MAKSSKISVLQIDARGISRVQIQAAGKGLAVLACDRVRGNWSTEDGSLSEALRTFLTEHPLEDDHVCSVLPRHSVTARILTLPTQDPDEASSMVRLSAEEFVPYSIDEMTIDECILDKLPSGESRVLAVLVHRDAIEGHVAVLRKAGVVPDEIYLSTACLATALRAVRGVQPEQFGVVDLAAGGLEVLVMEAGRLLYTRGIAGGLDWSEIGRSDEVATELGMEIRDSLSAYRRESEDGMGVDSLFVASDWLDIRTAAETIAAETGKECAPADFAGIVAVQGADLLDAPMLTALGAGLTALGKGAIHIDMMPASVSRVRGMESVRRSIVRASIFAAALLLALGMLFAQAVQQRKALIRDLEREAAALAPNALDVAAKLDKLSILERQVSREGTVLETLAAVCTAAPPELNITRFVYERNRKVDIFGRAKTRDIALDYASRLRNIAQGSLAYFANARSQYTQDETENRQPIVLYHVTIPRKEDPNAG